MSAASWTWVRVLAFMSTEYENVGEYFVVEESLLTFSETGLSILTIPATDGER